MRNIFLCNVNLNLKNIINICVTCKAKFSYFGQKINYLLRYDAKELKYLFIVFFSNIYK